jgi:hypothetical protein
VKKRNQTGKKNQDQRGGRSLGGASGDYVTRDPSPVVRDPVVTQRKPRRYIPAAMPTVCPTCGHSTRMDDGRHVDPVRRNILEYRTCTWCGEKLAAGRPMTAIEEKTLCTRADAVAEYEAHSSQ